MRPGQQNISNKRMRGRNRKGPNPLTRSYESNGGDVKIRGTALHVAEKYVQLARDATAAGDRVAGENYLQHAEHYYRIVAAAQAQMPQPQPVFRTDDDAEEEEEGAEQGNGFGGGQQPFRPGAQSAFGLADPQPFVNGNGQAQAEEESGTPIATPEEQRFEPRHNQNRDGDQGHGGGFRQRRRRPYRERYGENRDQASGDSNPAPAPSAESPQGDD
jgi:hypothetical protein